MKETTKTRAFYVPPKTIIDFADVISRNRLPSHQILGTTANGLVIIVIAYNENNKRGIDKLLKLNCHYTRELDRQETLNYDFSVPLMSN